MVAARDFLTGLYLDWINNYLSIEVFAEHHGITPEQAEALLSLAHDINTTDHPDA